MSGRPLLIVIALVVFLILSPSIFFTIGESEQGVVLMFQKPVRVIVNRVSDIEFEDVSKEIESMPIGGVSISRGAGLHMKLPFLQSVRRFDARLLEYDEHPSDVVTLEKIKPRVDSYARWRIRNPLKFLQSIQREELAAARLEDLIRSALRQELGRHSFHELIRSTTRPIVYGALEEEGLDSQTYHPPILVGREKIMSRITQLCDAKAREYGIQIADVRIKRADLPPENAESVFQRMMAERNRIARRHEEEGKREATKIRADTDRMVRVILAEAEKQDLEIRGEADATAADIYASGFSETLPEGSVRKYDGYGAAPEFFQFKRKLEAIENSITAEDRLFLTTDSPLFEILSKQPGEK